MLIAPKRRLFCLLSLLILGFAQTAMAANYPLELTNIKPNGTTLPASHRIYSAYPGLEYNIRAAVVGGAYPFTFALANAPEGMSVDARGVVRWFNPQADATPTITVRDAEGTQVSVTWTIRVTTDGFRFVSATNGTAGGSGTLASPWRNLADVYSLGAPTDIVYFRTGTYTLASLPRQSVGTAWERVEFGQSANPTTWIAYPEESPRIDFGYRAGGDPGALIRLNSNNAGGSLRHPYVDGFETLNSRIIGFQTGAPATFRRLRMHHLTVGGDGTNASFIMTLNSGETPMSGMVIQDCDFSYWPVNSVSLKIYSQSKILIEDTVHHDGSVAIELKGDVRQFSVRNNAFYNVSGTAIGGNMHGGLGVGVYGEVLYNNVRSGNPAVDINQDGLAGRIHVYRNTFVGRAQVRNTDSADGPFYFQFNVIVNSDPGTPSGSHIYHLNVTDPSRIALFDNLVGSPSDNIVDINGNLTSNYARYLGTHGHQLPGLNAALPTAPRNLRVTPGQ